MSNIKDRRRIAGAPRAILSRWLPAVVMAGVLLTIGACRWFAKPTPPVTEQDSAPAKTSLFRDVTAESGVHVTYHNGEEADHYSILESLGGGLAVLDFDGDGLLDLFVPGGGHFEGPDKKVVKGNPCRLYRNTGKFRFEDVTAQVGLEKIAFYTHGAAVADYDNDGWPDLLVTGWHDLALFHNEPADPNDKTKGRKFVEVSKQAGLADGLWTTSAAWGDLDGDGYADLYVCQYVDWSFDNNHPLNCSYDGKTRDVCSPKSFVGLEHKLYRNLGIGTFQDVSKEAGLRVARTDKEFEDLTWLSPRARARLQRDVRESDTKFGKGLGVIMVDVNGDGKPDIYVANDTVDNFLYVNRSTRKDELRFEEVGMSSGTARDDTGTANGSMGLGTADCFGTGRPSLWVANYENELHALYRNDCKGGTPIFTFYTAPAGLAVFGRMTVGWGTGFLDIDHHGWEDIFLITGHATRVPKTSPRAQRPMLGRNMGNGKFQDITALGGSYFQSSHVGRGAILADFDNDGRVDLAALHTNEPVVILRNEADTKDNHWLGVQLAGKDMCDVVGARIILEAGGRKQTRFAYGGGSYASSSDRRHVFGLGTAGRVEKLTVIWPNGAEQQFDHLELDRYYRLSQGKEKAEPLYTHGSQK
jgi:hypothetical protein